MTDGRDDPVTRAAIFHGLAPTVVSRVLAAAEPVTFPRGHTILREGDAGDSLYVIGVGHVKVQCGGASGRRTLIALLGPSDVFGELAVLDPGPRSATVRAHTDVRASAIRRAALEAAMYAHPELAERLSCLLAQRIRRTAAKVSETVDNDIVGRVAATLLELARVMGRPEAGVIVVDHGLTQQELSQLVGSRRESVNQALKALARRGWIVSAAGSVTILQAARLAKRGRVGGPWPPSLMTPRRHAFAENVPPGTNRGSETSTPNPGSHHRRRDFDMGIVDKAKNAAEDAIGKAKEVVGDATNNDDLKAEGQKDQGVSGAKKVGENIKDTFK